MSCCVLVVFLSVVLTADCCYLTDCGWLFLVGVLGLLLWVSRDRVEELCVVAGLIVEAMFCCATCDKPDRASLQQTVTWVNPYGVIGGSLARRQ